MNRNKRDRNHSYIYTVEVRVKVPATATMAASEHWDRMDIEAYNIFQAAHRLGRDFDDVRFIAKMIV